MEKTGYTHVVLLAIMAIMVGATLSGLVVGYHLAKGGLIAPGEIDHLDVFIPFDEEQPRHSCRVWIVDEGTISLWDVDTGYEKFDRSYRDEEGHFYWNITFALSKGGYPEPKETRTVRYNFSKGEIVDLWGKRVQIVDVIYGPLYDASYIAEEFGWGDSFFVDLRELD